MNEVRLHPELAPPRVATLPYAYASPLALIVGGVLLASWGALALSTPWSSPTLALTHVLTLGFLSLVALGVFVPIVALLGGGPVPWHRATHVVFYCLLIGAVGLVYGTATVRAGPVFVAIGAVGVLGLVFLTHAGVTLRRAKQRTPTIAAGRVVLWSFFLAASFGVWLAHGHGGMLFPGPRALWMQVHLSIALLGWIGGVLAASTWELLPTLLGGAVSSERAARWITRTLGYSLSAAALVPLAQYFGLLSAESPWLPDLAALLTAPAAVGIWIVHPIIAYHAIRSMNDRAAFGFAMLGIAIAPFTLVGAISAMAGGDASVGILFGWLALLGWAGSWFAFYAVVILPFLLAPDRGLVDARVGAGPLAVALALHVSAIAVGGLSIVLSIDWLTRAAGGLVAIEGCALMVVVVRRCGTSRDVATA